MEGGSRKILDYIANVKAFAIFFIVLMAIDIVLFVVTGGTVDRNYAHLVLLNLSLAGILQFLYIRFGKSGLLVSEIIVAFILIITIVEIILFETYGIFMPLSSAISNAQHVRENYSDELVKVIAKNVTFIIRFVIFYGVFIVTANEYLVKKQDGVTFGNYSKFKKTIHYVALAIFIVVLAISFIFVEKSNDFSFNVQKSGVKTALIKSLFKSNENLKIETKPSVDIVKEDDFLDKYNVLDIDFENLDETGKDERCKNVNEYVASRTPSNKNEYTGIFKGKNLILICAEAYSHHVINEELTPTLYRLTNNGFRFTDFYVPSWGGSTTSGEFAFLNGIIPNEAAESMKKTVGKNMCFTMPRVLKREGYNTGAYHNGNYKYYDRHLTHAEQEGFDYYIANGNGLEEIAGFWATDEMMLEKTLDSYHSKEPFCMYYMTISGHAFYNDSSNFKVIKNIAKVKEVYGDKYPDQVNNYICYQLYLEDALKKLIDGLEKYNLLDDTVICMVADHYPYGLNSASFTDGTNYIMYLYGSMDLDKYDLDKSMPIIWCASLEKEHKDLVKTIDELTSSIDLLPTLLNLFGAKYDSRLIAGRDVFSNVEPFVVYNSGSFFTKDGRYYKLTNSFISKDGTEKSKEYIDEYKEKARNLILFSAYIIEEDYYNYVFTNKNVSEEIKKGMGISSVDIPVTLAKKDYEHYVEYFKKCNEKYTNSKKSKGTSDNKNKKIAYLTFDDGPNKSTNKILDILKKNGIKATFFVVGNKDSKSLKKIKDEGHTIGLHSATHDYAYIYKSEDNFLSDLYILQNFVYESTGEYVHYLRFPGGSRNKVSDNINYGIMDKLRGLVEELGFEYYDWHMATGDSAEDVTKEYILSNVKRGILNNYNEYIILMHGIHSVTVDVLEDVIELCKENGYEFDRITDDTLPFHAKGVN